MFTWNLPQVLDLFGKTTFPEGWQQIYRNMFNINEFFKIIEFEDYQHRSRIMDYDLSF